jgi:hypothetical protein
LALGDASVTTSADDLLLAYVFEASRHIQILNPAATISATTLTPMDM